MKILVTSLAALGVPGLALAADLTVSTATGDATVPSNPGTVVALDLAAIDALDALGVELAGVPDITPPAYLQGAMEGVARVITLFEPD